jgi:carbamoyl-phosphate synthase small subunit
VFNTAMTGYQEILTDPSYAGRSSRSRIRTSATSASIARTSNRRAVRGGLVIRDLPRVARTFARSGDLGAYLRANGIVGIADIDTRKLTRCCARRARRTAASRAARVDDADGDTWRARAPRRRWRARSREGRVAARRRTTGSVDVGARRRLPPMATRASTSSRTTTASSTTSCACSRARLPLTVVPAQTRPRGVAAEARRRLPVERPGDPEPCDYAIDAIARSVDAGIPTFGICLGHQLLGSRRGARR